MHLDLHRWVSNEANTSHDNFIHETEVPTGKGKKQIETEEKETWIAYENAYLSRDSNNNVDETPFTLYIWRLSTDGPDHHNKGGLLIPSGNITKSKWIKLILS
jgi:hypothetical protein